MRVRILGVLIAVVLLAGTGSLAHAAGGGSSGLQLRPAILDVTGWKIREASAPLPSAADGVGPGSYLLIHRSDGNFLCTANFVWDGSGGPYVGAAGHCFLTEDQALATGTELKGVSVQVCLSGCALGGQLGGSELVGDFEPLGPVVFAQQSPGNVQLGQDFGLVTIPTGMPIRASVPVWGGPHGAAEVGFGTPVCLYGNGTGAGEVFATKARTGVGMFPDADDNGIWYADLPSTPGDSGSAVVNCEPSSTGLSGTTGIGILTHLIVGHPITAGTTVGRAMQLVQASPLHLAITMRSA